MPDIDAEIDSILASGQSPPINAAALRGVLHDMVPWNSSSVISVITSGATSGSPFLVPVSTQRVLVNKTTGAATYITMPLASTLYTRGVSFGVLIKDVKGDAPTNVMVGETDT
jgi:hypothetical protein